ncbi:MAG: primary-amine oxidase, partial [Acetobacteraceae bacterium]
MNDLGSVLDLRHPLDPLSAEEVAEAARIVRAAHDLGAGMRFETIMLAEPSVSRGDATTDHADRCAFVSVYDTKSGDLHEALVSLPRHEVTSWRKRPGARPRIAAEEFLLAENAVKNDARFIAALARRGITDLERVRVDPWSAGVFGHKEETDRRIIHGFAFLRDNAYDNQYAHPIEGLNATVDINRGEVLRVTDTGVVPVPAGARNYAARFQTSWRTDLKPIEVVQPQGPSFVVRGNEITWCGWRLRVGFTPREGLVLHDVEISDNGRRRPVLRRAALAEMVVPYGSPHGGHPRKNAFDCGEYGIGMLANSLSLGCDCLGAIHYFDAVANRIDGSPLVIPNAICVHEE